MSALQSEAAVSPKHATGAYHCSVASGTTGERKRLLCPRHQLPDIQKLPPPDHRRLVPLNSAAVHGGVRIGDKICAVDGRPVKGMHLLAYS